MLLSFNALLERYNVKPTGVLHLGAHLAEEAATYNAYGIDNVWWVEANPMVITTIQKNLSPYPGQRIINTLIWERENVKLPFNITNYDGMSSSIYEFGTHPQFSPDTVFEHTMTLPTRTVDGLMAEYDVEANFLNMDLQGAELPALRGATRFLAGVDYIMTEVNNAEVYVGCTQVGDLDEFLVDFERVETYWVPEQGWGDAFFVRNRRP